MKKKIGLLLFIILFLVGITGCGKPKEIERDSKKNQEGFQEGMYTVKNLTFNLIPGFEESDGIYTYRVDDNYMTVEIKVIEETDRDIESFMEKDSVRFYPVMSEMKQTKIHGNIWYKGKSKDGDTLYYIVDGTDIYAVMLSPVMTKVSVFEQLVDVFEGSLYFK